MKRNQPFLLLIAVAILVVAFSSFSKGGKNKFESYTKMDGGSYFTLVTKGSGVSTVDTGGAIFVKLKFLTVNDSAFLDINLATNLPSYPMRVDKSSYKGDFLELFSLLHAGDSAVIFVSLDSCKKYFHEEFTFEPKYDTMKYLGFAVKVDSIYSRDKVEILRAQANDELERQKQAEPVALAKYIQDNDIKTKPTPDGLYYIETLKGKGDKIKEGQDVKILFVCKYIDGTVFDASQYGSPFEFTVGQEEAIPGIEEGIKFMRKGGKATMIIPSELAYKDSAEKVKPYSTLIFEIEVVDVINAPTQ